MRYSIICDGHTPVIKLEYCVETFASPIKTISCDIKLDRSPCNFGNHRWWFLCPMLIELGKTCNRRVAILWMPRDEYHFGCRICHNLTYSARNLGRAERKSNLLARIAEIEKSENKIKRLFYKGQVTKNVKSYFKKLIKFENATEERYQPLKELFKLNTG